MQNKFLLETLFDTGLSDNECKVYLSLLELGVGTVMEIANVSGLKRTTLYAYLESLKEKGLLKTKTVGKRTKYYPENPEKLEELMKEKENKLERRLPELLGMYNLKGNDTLIGYQEGEIGVKRAYNWLLKGQKKGASYIMLAKSGRLNDLDKDFFEEYIERLSDSGIEGKLLLTHGPVAKMLKTFERQFGHEVRLLPVAEKIASDTIVCGNKVAIILDGPPPTAITFENEYLAQNYMNALLICWRVVMNR
jgi:sugar-specific transcriptional regulator TrmB